MPPLSKRGAPKLLRSVNNRPHATAADHEDDLSPAKAKLNEEDIYADPVSSGDEKPPVAPPPNQSENTAGSKKSTRTSRKGSAKMRVPKRGAFERGRELRGQDEENADGEGEAKEEEKGGEQEEERIYFGMGDTPPRKKRRVFVGNLHAGVKSKRAFGKKKHMQLAVPKESDYAHLDDLDAELDAAPSTTLPAASTASSSNPTHITSQPSPPSSPLSSASDYDDAELEAIQGDLQPVPSLDEDSTCALCLSPVDETEQMAFWAQHHHRTVRNQMLFCAQHKRSKAQREYTAHGFPKIDWARLPRRIRGFRSQLLNILRNEGEEESAFRVKHANRLVSGKAAALPSKRKPQAVLQEADAALEATSSTGYYGPRGRRVMMEVMTKDLGDVIREVAAKDPVVGRSGFAMFLQAVLVPELTLLLVMDDAHVGRDVAAELIRDSAELGVVLHGEVGDEVCVEEEQGEGSS